jgi:hypothetical protein
MPCRVYTLKICYPQRWKWLSRTRQTLQINIKALENGQHILTANCNNAGSWILLTCNCLRQSCSRSCCLTPVHQSQCVAHFYCFSIQSVRINKNTIEQINFSFCYFWGLINLKSDMDLFLENRCPPPLVLCKPTKLLLRRHYGLHSCIPGSEEKWLTFIVVRKDHYYILRQFKRFF